MSVVEDKKQERTKAKQQVTKASRRLTGAVDRNADIDVLTALMVELEKVYDDFCVIDEEYETLVSSEEHTEHQIVNGLDITAYRAVSSRFVPMDLSYPDDSYPGLDVSYPHSANFVPNPLDDSYPTNYDTKCSKQT